MMSWRLGSERGVVDMWKSNSAGSASASSWSSWWPSCSTSRPGACPPPAPAGDRPWAGPAMKDYYEELWQALPQDLALPDWELRRGFLLDEVRQGDRALDVGSGTGDFTAQ